MTRYMLISIALAIPACSESTEPINPDAASPIEGVPQIACLPETCELGTACGMQRDGCGGITWCGPCDCDSDFATCEVETPPIAEFTLLLAPGETLTAETSSLSADADSVLHVLDASGAELAMNDDLSRLNRASRVQYQAPPLGFKTVRIVARAKTASNTGTATLTFRNASQQVVLSYAMQVIAAVRTGDRLETVGLPGDHNATHVVYTLDGINVTGRSAGTTATAGGVSMALQPVGSKRFLIGRIGSTGVATHARLLRNDAANAGHDNDGDGLGFALEQALGTCASHLGTVVGPDGQVFACADAVDTRDTDGDGLRDDWEVRGRLDVSPPQALVRWGADPRHKDVFVEADYGKESPSEAEEAIGESEVTTWASYWEDRGADLTVTEIAQRAGSILNPDNKVGVRLHVDTGVEPTQGRWAALYGNWGGHDVLAAVSDGKGGWKRTSYPAARTQFMSPARRGIFRYGLRVASGSGQTAGLAFTWGGGGRVAAHELGHTAGLFHDGLYNAQASINCKPNYPSIMNYGFDQATMHSFSGGTRAALDNAALPERSVVSPLDTRYLDDMEQLYGHRIDRAEGHIDWNNDGVFANGTVEAYASNHESGACERTREGSTKPVGTVTTNLSPALARLGTRTMIFTAANGKASYSLTTSALHCRVPSGQCASFPTSGEITGLDSDYGIDAVTLQDRRSILVVGLNSAYTLRWTRVTGFSITTQAAITTPIKTLAGNAYDEPSLAIGDDGKPTLFYRDASGALFLRRYLVDSDSWSPEEPLLDETDTPVRMALLGSPAAIMAPAIVNQTFAIPVMTLAFAGPITNCLQLWDRSLVTGRWAQRSTALTGCSAGSPELQSIGRPALAWVPDPEDVTLHGRLHLVYRSRSGDDVDHHPVRQMTSVGWPLPRLAIRSLYDNPWTYAYGVDLLYEPGIDQNLRAAMVATDAPDDVASRRRIRFDPVADGITQFTYDDNNDWRAMRHGVCAPIAAEQPSSTRVTCPPAPAP